MNLAANILEQIISPSVTGSINVQPGLNLNDTTFAELLEKQGIKIQEAADRTAVYGQLGMPAGFEIEPLEGINYTEANPGQIDESGQNNTVQKSTVTAETGKSGFSDLFSNLLKTESGSSSLINFARKHAADAYNNFAKDYICSIQKLADNITSAI